MKTTNELIFDKLIRHQVYLLRLISKQSDDFITALTKNNPELTAFLNDRIPELDLANTYKSAQKWKRFEVALSEVRNKAIDGYLGEYNKDGVKIIDNEIKYMKALYDNSIALKHISTAIPAINAVNLLAYGVADGKTISSYFQEFKYGDIARISQTVRAGLIEQKAPYKIVNEIIGDKTMQYADGVTNITRNNAKSLVRTITQGISNNARSEYYKANSDIIKKERFTAVLDGRTTLECLSLDGQIFNLTDGPNPPLHRGCRSLRIAVVDGYELIGERSTITDTRTARVRNIDFRADAKASVGPDKWKQLSVKQRNSLISGQRTNWQNTHIGRAPAATTGSEWLKSTDAKFQNEFLGKKQAELFRSGELSLNKLVDNSGKRLSVDELYNLYANEFKTAGITP